MLSERPYLRGDYEREKTSALTWLLSALVAGFVIQAVMGADWFGTSNRLEASLGLSVAAVESGRVWVLLSHVFLHNTTFILHGLFNVLALYFLGRELLPMLGTKRFLGLFAAASVVGGLAWTAVHWRFGGGELQIGATAAVYALFTVFACFFPNQQITFLLFFVFPVTLKPKHVAGFLAVFSLAVLGLYELPGTPMPLGMVVASSAHLGGMLAGFLYYRFVHDSPWRLGSPDRPEIELPRWLQRAKKLPAASPATRLPPPPAVPLDRDAMRAEVDRILDKINSDGFGALTAAEKRALDDAKDLLSRR